MKKGHYPRHHRPPRPEPSKSSHGPSSRTMPIQTNTATAFDEARVQERLMRERAREKERRERERIQREREKAAAAQVSTPRKKVEQRISTLTEAQIMDKLSTLQATLIPAEYG